nr:MAG TPA: antitoxin [Caudoviricetes sp.]
MFGKIVKGAALFGLGYIIYKLGYGNGMKTADPTLKQLEADLLNGKLTMQEYMQKVNNRINELEGRC